jgi:hypothetical protein
VKRWASAVVIAWCCAGCGDTFTPLPPPEEDTADAIGSLPASGELSDGGITLSYYGQSTETGETPPTFTIVSEKLESQENAVYAFKDAKATIFTNDAEDLEIVAASVWLNYAEKRTLMEEGVVVQQGTMRITLSELEWNNEERVAISDKPLTLTDEGRFIEAQSMRYYPDEKRLVLGEAFLHLDGIGSPAS